MAPAARLAFIDSEHPNTWNRGRHTMKISSPGTSGVTLSSDRVVVATRFALDEGHSCDQRSC